MPQLTDLPPAALRALEDLLRRIFRGPHGIDLTAVSAATRDQVYYRRQGRQARLMALLALGAALVLLGWFIGEALG